MEEDKPYEPTQSRIERAKREGDVARSQELIAVVAFAAGLIAVAVVCGPIAAAARAAIAAAAAGRYDFAALGSICFFMLLPAGSAGCAAVACSGVQSGGLRFVAIRIKFERMSPAANLKRMFCRESFLTAVRATLAFTCAAAAIVPAFGAVFGNADAAWTAALRAAAVACVVGGLFAVFDFGSQFARWRKRLRMSYEELKRDRKEHDGDPLVRGRRRGLHRQLLRGSLRRVKDAAFVVTNPTHIAVAIEYRPPAVALPRVLVSAADESAARVRAIASSRGIPLVENVALARALYAGAKPGDYIPQDTYLAVAEIVAALGRNARTP